MTRLSIPGIVLFAAVGVAGSMGAGAVVLGYYLMYWAGLRLRTSRHRRLL